MSARGRFLSVLVTIVVALAGFVTVGALPAAAAPATVQYLALGDSYAAGQGAPPYLNICLQTDQSYPKLLDGESRIQLQENLTCTGATTSVVAARLPEPNDDTRLVTLTVGAADLGLSAVLAACTAVPPDPIGCQTAINNALALLIVPPGGESVLGGRLTDLYAEVAGAAPRARIVVTGYPHLFEPTAPPIDPAIIFAVNRATDELNRTIEQAVSVANDTDVNIHYVDVTEEFAGHGIGAPPRLLFINPPAAGLPDAFHPNADGYVAYADAVSAALPGGWLDKQKQSA